MKWRSWCAVLIVPVLLAGYVAFAATRPIGPASSSQPVGAVRPGDCRLIAQAAWWAGGGNRDPLMIDPADKTCDWDRLGLERRIMTPEQFDVACAAEREYGPCRGTYLSNLSIMDSPRYSQFRLRAQVEIGHGTGEDGGYGELCSFVNLGVMWLPTGCRPTFIV